MDKYLKEVLNSNILSISNNLINPNTVISNSDFEYVLNEKQYIKEFIIENFETQSDIEINKLIVKIKNLFNKNMTNEELVNIQLSSAYSEESEIVNIVIHLRNYINNKLFLDALESFFDKSNKYIKSFFKKDIIIFSDSFMEQEGALVILEPLKHKSFNDLVALSGVYDNQFHHNIRNVIFIYSLFDKYMSLIFMFDGIGKGDKISFTSILKDKYKIELKQSKEFIKYSSDFISSKLFYEFKQLRNFLTHNHIIPLEFYPTAIWEYVGLFLFVVYTKEILMKYYES